MPWIEATTGAGETPAHYSIPTVAKAAFQSDIAEQERVIKHRAYWQQQHDYFKSAQARAAKDGLFDLARFYKDEIAWCKKNLNGWKVTASVLVAPHRMTEVSQEIAPYADIAFNTICFGE